MNIKDICPNCSSFNVGRLPNPVDGPDGLEIDIFCRDCNEEWVEIESKN